MAGFTLQAYVNQFYRLLPGGDLWPTQSQTSASWESYIRAMVSELQRVDTSVSDWLEDHFADVTTTQLEDWERVLSLPDSLRASGIDIDTLTTTQRRQLVQDTLAPAPATVGELEAMATPFGYAGTVTQPANGVRYSGFLSGQRYNGYAAAHAYLYGYMPSATTAPPADLSDGAWTQTGGTSVLTNVPSPDGATTADRLNAGALTAFSTKAPVTGLSVGDEVQISVWAAGSLSTDGPVSFSLDLEQVSSTTLEGTEHTVITPAVSGVYEYRRYQERHTVTGGSSWNAVIECVSASTDNIVLWGFYVGKIDPLFEHYLSQHTPAHTAHLSRVVGDTQRWPLTYP